MIVAPTPDPRRSPGLSSEDRARLDGLVARYAGFVEIVGDAPCVARWHDFKGQMLEVASPEGASTAAVLLCQKVARAHREEL